MKISLKLVLNCEADAAWRAIRSPAVFREVSWPFTTFDSLEREGFPDEWSAGEHPVRGKAFGLVPIGDQVIRIAFPELGSGTRSVRDTGYGMSGVLATVTEWTHTMAVSPLPPSKGAGARTLYRDRLEFEVGALTPLAWPLYWAFWQWRGLRLKRLAAGWR